MIVSHQHRFIFIKTTKTAGTSVEMALSKYCGSKDIITSIEKEDEAVREKLGGKGPQNDVLPIRCYQKRDLNALRAFHLPRVRGHSSVELARKLVGETVWNSYFKFSIERNPYDKAVSRYYWSIKNMEEKPPMAEFLTSLPERKVSNWPIYATGEQVGVDFMIRFESLAEDLETVRKQIGLPESLELPFAKGNFRKDKRDYREILDGESRRVIEKICGRELKEFGYQWD